MKSKLSILVFVGLLATYVLLMLSLNEATAQNDSRGIRVQQESQAKRRVALVIGNSAYKDSLLLNPVNDARAMAQSLQNFGFEILYGENLSQNDMKRNIRAFGEKIRNGGVGLFYYAGHGIQINGRNYLIPIGAIITSEEEVEYESVDVGLVLAQMEAARNGLNIVILDACRNNPFARTFRSAQRGLASIDAPSGTLIAYATAPGSVASDGTGRNGLYTSELLTAMREPGLAIEDLFKRVRVQVKEKTRGKQVPWESSSLEGAFAFVGIATTMNSSNTQPLNPEAVELSFWESIKTSTTADSFRAYLEKYPDGRFAKLAKTRIYEFDIKPSPSDPPGTSNWMSSNDYQREFERQKALGNFAPVAEGRNYYGESQYRATFRLPPQGTTAWYCHHSLTKEDYDKRNQILLSQGYKQTWLQTFTDQSGVTRYQLTWIKYK